ncbi:DEAD/DEAH box helicase [Microterricola viridarii]|uniref:ATP-dependent helicase n=1 Tax=Microterricola viridarii TaxID=412690 RepID=A0A0X8E333_9MICO|nr:DEAD/DEAH box helicase [Microterricola viridarii]AMB59183.1 ATP-dependent helicase [Microterricola viridarii]
MGGTALNPAIEHHIVNSLGWSSLRPLQEASIAPVRSGADCLLVAPTAGGKTEAAIFPLLSNMMDASWQRFTVIYVTPLKALLNNLLPRLTTYADWVGRRVALWHGDVGDSERRRILADPPDILLTTPESLEAMLVSRRVAHRQFFAGLRVIVIDEAHSFAASDRGWHLIAVLERLQRIADRPIQRIGLSATLGNPEDVLTWMQGANAARDLPAVVVRDASAIAEPEITLDYVGSIENAAEILSRLYVGEKRLVFCQARAQAEELAFELRERGVTTYVSHSSLSVDERRLSERAFAEARDCVIVATSTLELGIDIGDLDRMIQIDSPFAVSSFLQRLGRTGRRPGTARNALFLTTTQDTLARAAGLLTLWSRGFVEPIVPPPHPRHLAAQQLLALALQEGRIPAAGWQDWWAGCAVMDDSAEVLEYLIDESFLVADGDFLLIGPTAEQQFGRRHFMDLLSSFIADLEIRVLEGTKEIGSVAPISLTKQIIAGDRPLLLNGRPWNVDDVDWEKHRVHVTAHHDKGRVRWSSESIAEPFALVRARRDVLLGEDPPVTLSRRAVVQLAQVRLQRDSHVDDSGIVLEKSNQGGTTLWGFAGVRAHETLLAALGNPTDAVVDNESIRFSAGIGTAELRAADVDNALPAVMAEAVAGLKFAAALPLELATSTLAERFVDRVGARALSRGSLTVTMQS